MPRPRLPEAPRLDLVSERDAVVHHRDFAVDVRVDRYLREDRRTEVVITADLGIAGPHGYPAVIARLLADELDFVTDQFDGYEVTPAMATPEGYMDLAGAPWLAFADGPIKREEREEVEGAEEQSWFGDGSISVATLEARHTLVDVPRVGEKVVSYTGITDIGRKIMRFCHWSFARDSGRLLAVLDEVGIGLNLQTRRSCEFPPAMREALEAQSHPGLF